MYLFIFTHVFFVLLFCLYSTRGLRGRLEQSDETRTNWLTSVEEKLQQRQELTLALLSTTRDS